MMPNFNDTSKQSSSPIKNLYLYGRVCYSIPIKTFLCLHIFVYPPESFVIAFVKIVC